MSEVKLTNSPNIKNIEDDNSHSDSEASIEDQAAKIPMKSEKKKPITNNFGRPRKHPYKPGKYKCCYCETMCSKPSVLTKHLRAHTNERPFPCSICKRSFKTKSNLSKHEKSKSHSSRLGNSNIECSQSKRERAEIMLQALSGVEADLRDPTESKHRIEFDSIDRKPSGVNSDFSSPTTSDERSVDSEVNDSYEMLKNEKNIEYITDSTCNPPSEMSTESATSCSGVLTINSHGGPITVEVQINLETMRHLQQGLSNLTSKRNCSSPIPSLPVRNDADLRAAESILHMANQGPHVPDAFTIKDELKKNGTTARKIPRSLSPLTGKSPDAGVVTRLSKPSSVKDSSSNKSTPLEESDQNSFKIQTKCLVKENLLKKMKKKQVQETTNLSRNESPVNRPLPEKPPKSPYSNDPGIKNLIACSKFRSKGKATWNFPKTHILTPNTQTIVLFNALHNSTRSLIPDSKAISPVNIEPISDSSKSTLPITNSSLEIDTFTLSKVITNTQSFHQHQGNKSSISDNLTATNSFTTSSVAVSSGSAEATTEMKLESLQLPVSTEPEINVDDVNKVPYTKQLSNQTTQESENESSPRLCIVEEPSPVSETLKVDKKISESDEEIDVVNTDSDDDMLYLQRAQENAYSELVSKKRQFPHEEDSEILQKDIKHEKCVLLHAPNINAKDLMQDCPLNLSANRQPTIPPVSQMSVSVLQNLYQTISPSNVIITSSNLANNSMETDSVITTLTNQNPAHPQSYQKFTPSTNSPSNGLHRDYPIFEDKVCCEVCSQMIEPSMLTLHKNMHIYTNSKDSLSHGNNNLKSGSSVTLSNATSSSSSSKIPFNKPRTYKCVVCSIAFRVIGHLRKHHKSKTHLLGLVSSGLLSKSLYSKIEQSKVPIQELIDQKTGNVNPDVLSHYISDWSQAGTDSEPH